MSSCETVAIVITYEFLENVGPTGTRTSRSFTLSYSWWYVHLFQNCILWCKHALLGYRYMLNSMQPETLIHRWTKHYNSSLRDCFTELKTQNWLIYMLYEYFTFNCRFVWFSLNTLTSSVKCILSWMFPGIATKPLSVFIWTDSMPRLSTYPNCYKNTCHSV
jgi:hypothetical protein